MNSFIITGNGVSLFIGGRPYTVNNAHINYMPIMDAVRAGTFDIIPGLINKLVKVKAELERVAPTQDDVLIDVEGGVVTCQGQEIPVSLANRIIRMLNEGFDINPMTKFVANLFNNPAQKTIDELYTFMEYGQLPITEDGHFMAYKRVRDSYMDCHSNSVLNKPIGLMTSTELDRYGAAPQRAGNVTVQLQDGETVVSMDRQAVNDNSRQTCSTGLHFCSYEYLGHFCGDRVIVVKINPADVVSIPEDYNNTKGRCCKYVVIGECTNNVESLTEKSVYVEPAASSKDNCDVEWDQVSTVWEKLAVPTTNYEVKLVVTSEPVKVVKPIKAAKPSPVNNFSDKEIEWYLQGYNEGKSERGTPNKVCKPGVPTQYQLAQSIGFADGKGKQAKKFK